MYATVARVLGVISLISFGFAASGCAIQAAHPDEIESESHGTDDLGLGDVDSDAAAASTWGDATTCKPIPVVPALRQPEITISLDGLTLHLHDKAGSYDRVFPIGPGALENGKSKTPLGLFHTGSDTSEVKDSGWGYFYPCKIWWTDPDTGKKSPVFAGLPFIRLSGTPTAGYAIHGPIDRFTASNGGSLRRGYVSHGCVRMQAEDVVEVYARIKGVPRVPVRIQKEIERLPSGLAVDVAARFIGAECQQNSDCAYDGGVCRIEAGATIGTCTKPCTHSCPDKATEGVTFCANDTTSGSVSTGICVPQASPVANASCARYEGRLSMVASASRPDRTGRADVCRPR